MTGAPENFNGNVNELARCRDCLAPFYLIFQDGLRDYCVECEERLGIKREVIRVCKGL